MIASQGHWQLLPIESLERGAYQPRKTFNPESLAQLSASLRHHGVIQPLVVHELAEKGRYEIIAGERRWRAAQMAGLSEVPCIVRHYSQEQKAKIATLENIQREDLNPIEEAQAYQRLIQEFHCTQEQIAVQLGKSREKISNQLRLLKLRSEIQQAIVEGSLSEGHGKLLAGLPPLEQQHYVRQIMGKKWSVARLASEIKAAAEDAQGKWGVSSKQAGHGSHKSHANHENCENRANQDVHTAKLAQQLSDYLHTPVEIHSKGQGGGPGGCLSIYYHDLDVLEGLLAQMGFKLF